jgi:hypothetical protein
MDAAHGLLSAVPNAHLKMAGRDLNTASVEKTSNSSQKILRVPLCCIATERIFGSAK